MRHLLYAEDREDDVFFFEEAVRRAGLSNKLAVHAVSNGLEAVRYLSGEGAYGDRKQNALPDVVLLDLKMPLRSGFEVLEWIREQEDFKKLPVFILSSSNQELDAKKADLLQADGYIVKPADLNALAAVVQRLAAGVGVQVTR